MIFSNKGLMYRLLVDNIPVGTNASLGTSIKLLTKMSADEQPSTMYSIYKDTQAEYVLFVTKNGLIKRLPSVNISILKRVVLSQLISVMEIV